MLLSLTRRLFRLRSESIEMHRYKVQGYASHFAPGARRILDEWLHRVRVKRRNQNRGLESCRAISAPVGGGAVRFAAHKSSSCQAGRNKSGRNLWELSTSLNIDS